MEKILDKRRESTNRRFEELRVGLHDDAARIDGNACVYATGSFARGEAGQFSDLDLFIVGLGNRVKRSLNRLDEICLKADLIRVTRELGIPEFSGDGAYLSHFTVDELIDGLGKPEDDATNTFTARLLLLLESRPLVGEGVYNSVIDQVVSAYWRDYEDHKTAFMPAFLSNDILRLWRTFCVNYEARTATEPAKEKAKRKLKNFKLKHSRLLTCYSGLLYFLSLYRRKGTVTPEDAIAMVKLSPTQRLAWLKIEEESKDVSDLVEELLQEYETFLSTTDEAGEKLVLTFMDKSQSHSLLNSAYEFGDKVFDLMEVVGTEAGGTKNRFYRLLVV